MLSCVYISEFPKQLVDTKTDPTDDTARKNVV